MSDDNKTVHGPDEPHMSFTEHVPSPREVQRVWATYWMPLLRDEGGTFNYERLKGELYDAWFLVNEARKVYRHITGGLMDDLTAASEGVISMAERAIQRRIYAAVHKGESLEAPLDWEGVNAFLAANDSIAIPKSVAEMGLPSQEGDDEQG